MNLQMFSIKSWRLGIGVSIIAVAVIATIYISSDIGNESISELNNQEIALGTNDELVDESSKNEEQAEYVQKISSAATVNTQSLAFIALKLNSRAFSGEKFGDVEIEQGMYDKIFSISEEILLKNNIKHSRAENKITTDWFWLTSNNNKKVIARLVFIKEESDKKGMRIIEETELSALKQNDKMMLVDKKTINNIIHEIKTKYYHKIGTSSEK